MNTEKLAAGLRMGRKILGGDIESARGVRLLLRNIDTSDPGPVHAHVGYDIPAPIGNGDVHRLADFAGLFLGCCDHSTSVR
jgi:hypothetical protein